MNLDFLLGYINLVTLGICLCVGLRPEICPGSFSVLGNQYIPLIMLILGTVVNVNDQLAPGRFPGHNWAE